MSDTCDGHSLVLVWLRDPEEPGGQVAGCAVQDVGLVLVEEDVARPAPTRQARSVDVETTRAVGQDVAGNGSLKGFAGEHDRLVGRLQGGAPARPVGAAGAIVADCWLVDLSAREVLVASRVGG